MERYYNIAGQIIKIIGEDNEMFLEEHLLSNFRCEKTNCDREIRFALVEKLSEPTGECIYQDYGKRIFRDGEKHIRYIGSVDSCLDGAHTCIRRNGDVSEVEVLKKSTYGRLTTKIVLTALEAEHFIAMDYGFILHASYIEYEGKGILFTAPSGTGKSTQADLWNRLRGAEIMNGDKVCIKKDGDKFYAWGIPYAGSSGIARQGKSPLLAIVYLSQAKETKIEHITGRQAFRSVWEGISVNSWNSEDVSSVSQTLLELLSEIPVYHLACTPDESAIIALEQEIEKR